MDEVDDAGDLDGPTIVLTPRPALGTTWSGSLEIVRQPSPGPATAVIDVDWNSVVVECGDRGDRGGWSTERQIVAASVAVDPGAADPERPIDQPEPLIGVVFDTDYDDYGSYLFERIPLEELGEQYPDGAWYNLYLDIDRFFGWLMPTMPSDLVGIGATWDYSIDDEIGRLTTGLVYSFQVIDIEGTTYVLEFDIDGAAGFVGRGQIAGDITKPLPVRAELSGQVNAADTASISILLAES